MSDTESITYVVVGDNEVFDSYDDAIAFIDSKPGLRASATVVPMRTKDMYPTLRWWDVHTGRHDWTMYPSHRRFASIGNGVVTLRCRGRDAIENAKEIMRKIEGELHDRTS